MPLVWTRSGLIELEDDVVEPDQVAGEPMTPLTVPSSRPTSSSEPTPVERAFCARCLCDANRRNGRRRPVSSGRGRVAQAGQGFGHRRDLDRDAQCLDGRSADGPSSPRTTVWADLGPVAPQGREQVQEAHLGAADRADRAVEEDFHPRGPDMSRRRGRPDQPGWSATSTSTKSQERTLTSAKTRARATGIMAMPAQSWTASTLPPSRCVAHAVTRDPEHVAEQGDRHDAQEQGDSLPGRPGAEGDHRRDERGEAQEHREAIASPGHLEPLAADDDHVPFRDHRQAGRLEQRHAADRGERLQRAGE